MAVALARRRRARLNAMKKLCAPACAHTLREWSARFFSFSLSLLSLSFFLSDVDTRSRVSGSRGVSRCRARETPSRASPADIVFLDDVNLHRGRRRVPSSAEGTSPCTSFECHCVRQNTLHVGATANQTLSQAGNHVHQPHHVANFRVRLVERGTRKHCSPHLVVFRDTMPHTIIAKTRSSVTSAPP